MEPALETFVERALARGEQPEQIARALEEAGWPRDDVAQALGSWATDVDFPIPVPRPRPYGSAQEAFVNLVLFLTLYIAAIAWGQLLFVFIDRAVADGRNVLESAARWPTASLLIAAPVFFLLSRRTWLESRSNPEKRTSRVRKWLTYLTLFVTATVVLVDLITLVYRFLEGDLTTAFLLKVLVVGGIAGVVFAWYRWLLALDDRDPSDHQTTPPWLRPLVAATGLAVIASLVGGVVTAGSPSRARGEAADTQRVQRLVMVSNAIDETYELDGQLPATLDDLTRERGVLMGQPIDPITREPLGYRVLDESSYELCATFDLADDRTEQNWIDPFWKHPAGRHCFTIEVVEESDD